MILSELIEQAKAGFRVTFQREPEFISVAPGRVNLIGEHTDYHEGFVFPAAIDRYVVLAGATTSNGVTKIAVDGHGASEDLKIGKRETLPETKWVRYSLGSGSLLSEQGFEVPGFQSFGVANLPEGAGLSSSAAVEVAYARIYDHFLKLKMDKVSIARLCQKSENELLNSPCGLLDQLSSLFGQDGEALFMDTREPVQIVPTPLPPDVSIVVCNTGEQHNIGDSGYPLRRRQSEEAARMLGVTVLRDTTSVKVEEMKDALGDVLYRRAKHVVTDSERCGLFRKALLENDKDSIFALMKSSHESARDDYEISTPLLDATAEACWTAPGCIGARMTGGGFGGSCVALVSTASVGGFIAELEQKMLAAGGTHAKVFACHPSRGAYIESV